MFVRNKFTAEKREREGLTSHFLLSRGDVEGDQLGMTWVDVAPGGRQRLHHHPEVQVYVIVQGSGLMHVGEETRRVQVGDLIFIPSDAMHGIENDTEEPLSYVSAATPAFDLREAYDRGQLTPGAYEQDKPA